VCTHGADLFLQDDWLCRSGTDNVREPSEGGGAPMGPAHVPAIVAEQKGLEPERGVFESAEGSFPRTGEITHGCICDLGDLDGGEVPRAGQAG
jgi:hypothetical protein